MKYLLICVLLFSPFAQAKVSWQSVNVFTDTSTLSFDDCSSSQYYMTWGDKFQSSILMSCQYEAILPVWPYDYPNGQEMANFTVSGYYQSTNCRLLAEVHTSGEDQLTVDCRSLFLNGFEDGGAK